MLPRTKRISRQEFSLFFGRATRFHSPALTLLYAPSPDVKASAVIPKKIARSAVIRNKFRRRVYDVFERLIRNGLTQGAFIVIAKEKAPHAHYSVLQEEIQSLIHKTGVLR